MAQVTPAQQLFDLTGEVALVTGGSRGIGKAVAIAFADAGADVAIVGRDGRALETALSELRAAGHRAEAFTADLSRLEEIESMIGSVKAKLGPIDILICNVKTLDVRPQPQRPYTGFTGP